MKYIRVVFAVEEKDIDLFDTALEIFIESDECQVIEGIVHNPIQGAYVSNKYDTRGGAIYGPWYGLDLSTLKED
jgi:hypothetical protein